jgi:ankyrin repeat protein
MKTRTHISILILVLAVMVITGKSATASDTEVLLKSVKSGDYAEVKRIIGAGADVNAQDNVGRTALMRASSHGHQEFSKLLIEAGAKEY